MVADGARVTLNLSPAGGGFSGSIGPEGGSQDSITVSSWDSTTRWLSFKRNLSGGGSHWYRMRFSRGVTSGRFSTTAESPLSGYALQVTGWSPTYLDTDIIPRTWKVTTGTVKSILRIDRDSGGTLVGRFKGFDDTAIAGAQDDLEYDLSSISWNGTNLSFTYAGSGFTRVFTGTVTSSRLISGTFTHNAGAPQPWNGERSEVLSFGLGSRLSQRSTWQDDTRVRIRCITDGMRRNDSLSVPMLVGVDSSNLFQDGVYPAERDDDPDNHPANYTMKHLRFEFLPGGEFDTSEQPPPRVIFGYLAIPNGSPPTGGWRAIVALNGHTGTAQGVMTKADSLFWYGDAYARRGFVVLAVDIGHRPIWSYPPLTHPEIKSASYTSSDWEEDGERTFQVRRAIDYLMTVPGVNTSKIIVSGLSLGAEITTYTAATDTRIVGAVLSGYSPDITVLDNDTTHFCFQWFRANFNEYVSISDFHALLAPKPLIVETGLQDHSFSPSAFPWASDKQVMRRSRAAYGTDASKVTHYLHYDAHAWHFGDVNALNPGRPRGVQAAAVIEPIAPGDTTWQTDSTVTQVSNTVFDLIDTLVPP